MGPFADSVWVRSLEVCVRGLDRALVDVGLERLGERERE